PKDVVVMPAYNAGRTLRLTYEELPKDTGNLVILVNDGSTDAPPAWRRDRRASRRGAPARAGDLRPQPQLWVRRQPEDVLRRSPAGGRRRGRDGASRLSVRSAPRSPDHRSDREGRRRRGPRLAPQGGLGPRPGHAVVEISGEPIPQRPGKPGV